jgi:hypothetical protein
VDPPAKPRLCLRLLARDQRQQAGDVAAGKTVLADLVGDR